jgi:metal-responsive CopG/Arc/MetJ family transcriptional regulator
MAKVNVTIPDELLKRVDDYADSNYTSRSGLITLATSEFLNAKEAMSMIKNLSLAIGKIAETGNVDDETLGIIHDFERWTKIVSQDFN